MCEWSLPPQSTDQTDCPPGRSHPSHPLRSDAPEEGEERCGASAERLHRLHLRPSTASRGGGCTIAKLRGVKWLAALIGISNNWEEVPPRGSGLVLCLLRRKGRSWPEGGSGARAVGKCSNVQLRTDCTVRGAGKNECLQQNFVLSVLACSQLVSSTSSVDGPVASQCSSPHPPRRPQLIECFLLQWQITNAS